MKKEERLQEYKPARKNPRGPSKRLYSIPEAAYYLARTVFQLTYPMDNLYSDLMMPSELRAWRKEHGYTQERLARALGVIPLTVSRWEREGGADRREIPPFLHLALRCLELEGGEKR